VSTAIKLLQIGKDIDMKEEEDTDKIYEIIIIYMIKNKYWQIKKK